GVPRAELLAVDRVQLLVVDPLPGHHVAREDAAIVERDDVGKHFARHQNRPPLRKLPRGGPRFGGPPRGGPRPVKPAAFARWRLTRICFSRNSSARFANTSAREASATFAARLRARAPRWWRGARCTRGCCMRKPCLGGRLPSLMWRKSAFSAPSVWIVPAGIVA